MRRLGIAVMVFAVFAGIIRAEEETAAPLAPPNYDYFEYAADSNKYLKDWTKFLSAVMAQKAEGAYFGRQHQRGGYEDRRAAESGFQTVYPRYH